MIFSPALYNSAVSTWQTLNIAIHSDNKFTTWHFSLSLIFIERYFQLYTMEYVYLSKPDTSLSELFDYQHLKQNILKISIKLYLKTCDYEIRMEFHLCRLVIPENNILS